MLGGCFPRSFAAASAAMAFLCLGTAHANSPPARSLCVSSGLEQKLVVNEYGFLEVPLGYQLASWFLFDGDGDGRWEIAAKTLSTPERFGVFDPKRGDWLAGPDSTPIGPSSWTPVDLEGDGGFEYAYVLGHEVRVFVPATGIDSMLWEIPYQAVLQTSFWGRSQDGTPLVFVVTSDGHSGGQPPTTRHTHDLLTGAPIYSGSGSALGRFVLSGYLGGTQPVLVAEDSYRYTYHGPAISIQDEWHGFDLFDLEGNWLDRLVYWNYFGSHEPNLFGPQLLYAQIAQDSGSGAVLALHFSRNHIFFTEDWWLDRLLASSGGYEQIRHWNGPASSAVAYDLFGVGQPSWLFPLTTAGWERRSLLNAAVIDTVPGPANVPLSTGPLLSPSEVDLFYIADSTLYLYEPDIPSGIFDDPRTQQSEAVPMTLTAYPNPFNAAVTLAWSTSVPVTSLTVHNILGQTVQRFDVAELDGTSGLTWDGRDANGRPVASGIYFARLTTRDQAVTAKIVLLR